MGSPHHAARGVQTAATAIVAMITGTTKIPLAGLQHVASRLSVDIL